MKKYLLTLLLLAIGTAGLYPDNDAAEIYLKKAQELAKKKDYKEALSNFNKAVNEAPELPAVYLALGELYRELNESQEASANFRKALELIEQQGGQD
ncbi:MAG TPA: tetratricopeptide repeat protein, partial [Planctomycetota bacterium]|nr:tetratricopeptide repeat protein [Planctomycetota bacterium]